MSFVLPILLLVVLFFAPSLLAFPQNGIKVKILEFASESTNNCGYESPGIAFEVASLAEQDLFAVDPEFHCQKNSRGYGCVSNSSSLTGRSYSPLYNVEIWTGCIDMTLCVGNIQFTYGLNSTWFSSVHPSMGFYHDTSYEYEHDWSAFYAHNVTSDVITVSLIGEYALGYSFMVEPLL